MSQLNEWIDYSDGHIFKRVKHNIFVVKSKSAEEPVSLFCELCKFSNMGVDDVEAVKRSNCCLSCEIRWVDVDRPRWFSGWRPSGDQFEKYLNDRRRRLRQPIT